MHFHVAQHNVLIRIGIAVAAEMAAGIICADISCEIAGAFFSVIGIRRHLEVLSDGCFKCPYSHTAGTVCPEGFEAVGYDDAKWQSVTVPHDWAIYGPFSINNDKQNVAITQDGQQEAMEHAGSKLNKVGGIFFNLMEAHTNDDMQAIAEKVSPMLTEFSMYTSLNAPLFERVKAVYEKKDSLGLDKDQMTLLENSYKGFVRGGANLSDEERPETIVYTLNDANLAAISAVTAAFIR